MRAAFFSLILLLPLAKSSPCPYNYKEITPGGDCYQVKLFFDYFAGQYTPKSFEEVETECSRDGGGLLTSIHSQEENDALFKNASCTISGGKRNIGLKCTGKVCKWDDGSPVNYTNFYNGEGPSDGTTTYCYGFIYGNGEWSQRSCGKQQEDCWICRVKARTIDCVDGETEYKGGCVSVHSTPLDQKTAEASCPGGGHLVSIHSGMYGENDLYVELALEAGLTGTVYIGGQYTNGKFEWIDGSHYGMAGWANGFPNPIFGNCVQMLLESEFGNQGQWTNIDCTVKQPYICFRDGSELASPSGPKADPRCPGIQYLSGSGTIYSPNYPLSIPSQQSCEYVIGSSEGTRVNLKFPVFDCQSGTTLSLFDGLNSNQPFAIFTTSSPTPNDSYTTQSNVMKIVFSTNGTSSPIGTGWEAEFTGI